MKKKFALIFIGVGGLAVIAWWALLVLELTR